MNTLTPTERTIAALVAEGLTNREIAARVSLSAGTVRNYVSACLSKLYLPNRAALTGYVLRNGAQPATVANYDPDRYCDAVYPPI